MFYRYNFDPQPNQQERAIVLDLDETLVHTFEDNQIPTIKSLGLLSKADLLDIRSRMYAIPLNVDSDKPAIIWGIKRPGLDSFLRFCTSYFKYVCVWSAGQYDYVHAICKEIFRDVRQPDIILTRNDCACNSNKDLYKPLAKLYERVPGMHPHNTIVIDDRQSTFQANRSNGYLIAEYFPTLSVEGLRKPDRSLQQLAEKMLTYHPHPEDIRGMPKL